MKHLQFCGRAQFAHRGAVKVNQKWLFSGSSLKLREINFGLETRVFKPGFCFQFSIQNFRFGSAITEKSEFNFGLGCLLSSQSTMLSVGIIYAGSTYLLSKLNY